MRGYVSWRKRLQYTSWFVWVWNLVSRHKRRTEFREQSAEEKISKRKGVTPELRKLRNEKLNNWYSLPNIIKVFKLRRMWHVTYNTYVGDEKW